ncbi:MAG TPA: beta-1,6-N-acetylglucosaminyltransferase [Thermoanaerobaculia bacterium]|nr:beta-1,6-N-acetylglucosaminyltransferase [Thermoanaerobaculia bacterium]
MTACYLIRTHRDPEQIYRLVRAIKGSSPEALVVLCHDSTGCRLDLSPLRDLSQVSLFTFEGAVRRGGFAMIETYFLAIEWLLGRGADFDWLIYLSGQDYPTRPAAEIESFLATTEYDGFIRYWDIRSEKGPWGASRRGFWRYHYQYYTPPPWVRPLLRGLRWINGLQPWIHLYLTYGIQVGVRAGTVPFDDRLVCYAGLQWNALSASCVRYLAEAFRANPRLIDYYRRTILPDESLLQTLLVNSGRFRLCPDDKRYYDFSGSRDGHPRVLTVDDYPRLVSGDFHFARKFDPRRDSRILDLLDARIASPAAY